MAGVARVIILSTAAELSPRALDRVPPDDPPAEPLALGAPPDWPELPGVRGLPQSMEPPPVVEGSAVPDDGDCRAGAIVPPRRPPLIDEIIALREPRGASGSMYVEGRKSVNVLP